MKDRNETAVGMGAERLVLSARNMVARCLHEMPGLQKAQHLVGAQGLHTVLREK